MNNNKVNKLKIDFNALGTINQIEIFNSNDESALKKAVHRVYEIDDKMSVFNKDSEVSRINSSAGKSVQPVSSDTFYVVERAKYYSRLSKGAFNLLIRPLINLWGINTKDARVPEGYEIESTIKLINYEDIILNKEDLTIKLLNEKQCIDLGAIAKGYAADEVKRILLSNNISSALIDLGGNIYALGNKIDGGSWNIGVQDPLDIRGSSIGIIQIKNKSIVTSGNYERFFIKDGVRYHHIIDPRTGRPSSNGIISVTIISDYSMDGDGLSTCCYVMGLLEGYELINSIKGIDAIFITEDNKVYITPRIRDYFILIDNKYTLVNL